MDDASAKKLTHIDEQGAAHMVDVSPKAVTAREASASARVVMEPATLALILAGQTPKGDVFATARIAGIMAAKRTSQLIPLCHPLPIESVRIDITPEPPDRVLIRARVVVTARTGVEMEALTAAGVAALTLYDMCKAVDRAMVITDLRVDEKTGGRSGHYVRDKSTP